MSLLIVKDLAVHGAQGEVVEPISLSIEPGQAITLIGETGSGKSLFAQSLLGILPKGLAAKGDLSILGETHSVTQTDALAHLWGRSISVLPQEPWRALDPLMRSRAQVEEVHRLVSKRSDAKAAADADLAAMDLTDAADRFPFELSGGMAQRLAIAAARAGGAQIVVADEPTKGLDLARRDEVARRMRTVTKAGGGLLTITHDLEFAEALGGEVIVLRDGQVVERGPAEQVLKTPAQDYTKDLIASEPRHWAPLQTGRTGDVTIRADDLTVARGERMIAKGIDLTIRAGEIVGLSGPSGIGKSSLGDTLLGLLPARHGAVVRDGALAPHRFQKLWQDPPAAFAPTLKLGRGLDDLMRLHGIARDALPPLMERLRLDSVLLDRLPAEVSGGELQRLAIARALLLDPVFLFADEPTSRLDPLTQREVIHMLVYLARSRQIAVLMVSHDPDLSAKATDRQIHLSGDVEASEASLADRALAQAFSTGG
nr:ATP-binding cassette domain-containing protein [uncultured Cohaesibacter sp.]